MKHKRPEKSFRDLESVKAAELAPKERVLQAALDLFYQHGVHSVGVDRIIAESGVAKMTFYRHFPSKAKLVGEYLAHKDQAWQCLINRFTGDASRPARERLLGIFRALECVIRDPSFRGCPFIKGLAEFGPEQREPEVKRQLAAHFADLEKLVTGLVKQIYPKESKKYIQPLMSLIVGTVVIAHATGSTDIAARNLEAAKRLLKDQRLGR